MLEVGLFLLHGLCYFSFIYFLEQILDYDGIKKKKTNKSDNGVNY